MSQDSQHTYIPFLDDPRPDEEPGDLWEGEIWWAERQEAFERAGYMLRPRNRPDWQPSWHGTNKPYDYFEDGQSTMGGVRDHFPFSLSPIPYP
jgi:hypothetical protein